MKKIKQQKGFTLIEILVAMSVFVLFLGVLINSYMGIVRSQRDADFNRILYMEARNVFEVVVQELRDGMIDYAFYLNNFPAGGQNSILLVSKDLSKKVEIKYDEGDVLIGEVEISDDKNFINIKNLNVGEGEFVVLNDRISVKELKFYVSPLIDPYDDDYVFCDLYQFHPKITVYAEFEKDRGGREPIDFYLQTTVSSRIYNQLYFNVKDDEFTAC